jgi:hypothetical protein
MHVTAFGLHRLEATAPWGVRQEKQTEENVTPSDKKMSPTDLAHFAMLSRGNCWLSVEGIPEPIPLTGGDCFLLARGTSIVLRDSPLFVLGAYRVFLWITDPFPKILVKRQNTRLEFCSRNAPKSRSILVRQQVFYHFASQGFGLSFDQSN